MKQTVAYVSEGRLFATQAEAKDYEFFLKLKSLVKVADTDFVTGVRDQLLWELVHSRRIDLLG